jgi:hypothetical protein
MRSIIWKWLSPRRNPMIRHSGESRNPAETLDPGLRRGDVTTSAGMTTQAKGQATTEVVLLMPLFMFFLYAFAKIFAMLLLVQKLEIASYYAARRWQLESHRNATFAAQTDGPGGPLQVNILKYVNDYLGLNGVIGGPLYQTSAASFLGITGPAQLTVTPTQVWQIVTLTVNTRPINMALINTKGYTLEVTKYVPNRDRPIAFVLPGLQK